MEQSPWHLTPEANKRGAPLSGAPREVGNMNDAPPAYHKPVLVFRAVGPARMVIATLKLYIEGRGNKTLGQIVREAE